MEMLRQCKQLVWQLQKRITELEPENEQLRAQNVQLRAENEILQALLQEQERAAEERYSELTKVNDALKQTLDLLVTESDLNRFLGHVLKVIAQQLDAPLTEYWCHPEPGNIAYLGLSCLQSQILTPAEQPGHPGVVGFPVPPEMIHNENLHRRQRHFVVDDAETNRFHVQVSDRIGVDVGAWYAARGVRRQINVPLVLGDKSIGALLVWFPGDCHFTKQQIELAYALAQQVTLAIRLTQLAEPAGLAAIAREREAAALEQAVKLENVNAILRDSVQQLSNEADLETFLGYVITKIAQQIEANYISLFRYDESNHTLTLHLSYLNGNLRQGTSGDELELWAAPFRADITPAFELMCQHKQFFTLAMSPIPPEEFAWPGVMEWMSDVQATDAAHLVLFVGNNPVGSMGLAFTNSRTLQAQDQPLVLALAQQCAIALRLWDLAERQRQAAISTEQEKAASERIAELVLANNALRRSVGHLTGADSLNTFLVAVLQEAIQASGAVSAAVFVYDASENTLLKTAFVLHGEVVDIATDPRTEIWRAPVPADLTNGWQIMSQERQIIWSDNDNPPPEHWSMSIAWHHQFGHKNIASIPLFVGEQVLGFLGLCFATYQKLSETKLEQCWSLAQHAALALRVSQLAEAAKLAAISREQEKAAQEKAAELAESNAALSASSSRLRTLFEQLPVSLQIFSDTGVCLEVNSAWSELWQLPSSAVIGKSCLVTPSSPASQLPNSPFTPYLQRCFAGEPVSVPPLFFDPVPTFQAGRARWVQTYIYPIKDRANELREVLLIHQDIHALKQAEQVARGQTQALIQVLSALVSEPHLEQLLAQVLLTSTAQLNAPASTLWLCDAATGQNLLHLVCCGDRVSRELPVVIPESSDSLCVFIHEQTWQEMERTRHPIVLTDIATHTALEYLRPWLLQQQVKALMLVPLLLGNQLIGSFGIHISTRNYFRPEEMQLAQALAHQITLAIQLTNLAQQARQSAILEERNRLAGEIHDTLAQTFTGISIQLDVAKRIASLDPEEARSILDRVSELAQVGLQEARQSVWALYSPTTEDGDLAQSLLQSVEQMTSDTALSISVNVQGTPCLLSMYVSQNLLRIGQEAVTNILKHAQAEAIWIELVYESDYICLSVRDNGRGFVLSATNNTLGAGFGLIGMYQRAERIRGQLTITTQPGEGTEIVIRVPVS